LLALDFAKGREVTEPIQFLTDKNGKRLAVVVRMDVYGHILQKLEALRRSVQSTKLILWSKKHHS